MVIDAWSRYFVELLSRLVCQLTISLHTFLCMTRHQTMKKIAIQTWFCNCPQYLCSFAIVVECIPSTHDPGKMLVLPNRLLFLSTFHIGSRFCFFPAIFMSSTYTDKTNLFSRCTKRHSQFGIFSQPCFNRFFSNCFSLYSPAKG